MYKQIPGGTVIDVQGLKCCTPPVGSVFNVLTGKVEKRGIISRSKKPEKQYWERAEMPDWYMKKVKLVEQMREKDPEYSDPKCDEYEATEWDRRLNGCWVMMNGEPVYLTGLHYMYLQWWKIDIGYPKFRTPDLEYFYFLQYCIEDPLCLGMIEITKRRFGKSFRAGLFAYEYTSRTEEAQSGIQSKTGADAKKFFSKTIIRPFKRLPKFFRPTYDTSSGITPKSELRFQQDNIRGRRSEEILEKDELESLIDFGSAETVAYDGQKLHRAVNDEFAKTTECNIYDRHDVIRYCLLDDEGKVIGKALYTSTVEKLKTEKDSISESAKLLWEESDQNNRINGVTPSGLYRFFMSAKKTRNFNLYGVPDEAKTEEQILRERSTIRNSRSLSNRIRKEPLTIEEAFRADGDKCLFNDQKLNDQRDYLMWNKDITVRGNLIWENGVRDSRVIWVNDKKGRWEIPIGFVFKPEEQNNIENVGGLFYPKNNYRFGSGLDPYDHDKTEYDNKRSKAASFVKQKNNINNFSDPFIKARVCKYLARPATAPLMYEDMIKQCVFFGCSILYESNKPGIKRYFQDRGYGAFLLHMPGYKDPGIPATPENKETGVELLEADIEENSEKNVFIDLIDDFLVFDLNKSQKHDLSMAAIWTEVACSHRKFQKIKDEAPMEVEELFTTYEINYN